MSDNQTVFVVLCFCTPVIFTGVLVVTGFKGYSRFLAVVVSVLGVVLAALGLTALLRQDLSALNGINIPSGYGGNKDDRDEQEKDSEDDR